jgi:alkaline phosphatase D
MTNEKADAMLWLGDNIYLRESDWDSRSGIYKRYTHTRLQPELQAFLRSTHHYAIWDDHDYGPNDADRSYNGKYWTREAFKHFWGNPSYGENNEGTYTQFTLSDCHFFMLDNRWWRSPNKRKTGTREILGEQQLNWLIDALKNSQASFKFVCIGGQVLNTAAVYENYAGYTNERDKLLQLLDEEEIKNVIFLTGDRHHSEISSLKLKNIQVFDITSSPLTSKAYYAEKEDNKNRIKGTLTGVRNYTTLNIKGSRKNRVLNIENKDSNGKILWTYEIQSIK